MKSHLVLHCGGKAATYEELTQLPLLEGTETWVPLPHFQLVNTLEEQADSMGLVIKDRKFGLASNGHRLFAMWHVASLESAQNPDYGLVVALRNSTDRSMSIILGAGTQVFACDNLAFCAEVQVQRKHTKWAWRDIPKLLGQGLGKLSDAWNNNEKRVEAYRNHQLSNGDAARLILESSRIGHLPPSIVPDVWANWQTPDTDRTAWGLHNTFTAALKGTAMDRLPRRTIGLQGMLDAACGLLDRNNTGLN